MIYTHLYILLLEFTMPCYLYLSKNPEYSKNSYIAAAYTKSGLDIFYHDVAVDMRDDQPLLLHKGKRRIVEITDSPVKFIECFHFRNSIDEARKLMNESALKTNITVYFIQIEGVYDPEENHEHIDLRKYIARTINRDQSHYTEKVFDVIHGLVDFFKEAKTEKV